MVFRSIVLAALLAVAGYGASGVLSGDATVQSGYPSSNFGALPNLQVGPTSHTLLKFQLPEGVTGAALSKARLRLWVNKVGTPGGVRIGRLNGTWEENAVTFSNAPLIDAGNPVVFPVSSPNAYVLADLTLFVKAALDRNEGEVRWGLIPEGATDALFDSKENTATGHAPELELDLTGPAGPTGLQGPVGPVGPAGPALQLSGYQMLEYELSAFSQTTLRLRCPAAYPNLVAGGCGFPYVSQADVYIRYSGPLTYGADSEWQCNADNRAIISKTVRVYAQCSK
jgi:hypothetical protein